MGAAPGVTPRRGYTWQVRPGAAVRDSGREDGRCGAAAGTGGDAGGREQVAVPGTSAVSAGHDPPGGLGDPLGAGRAGRGGAPLIHQPHLDPRLLGLVAQHREQVANPPGTHPLVVPPARRQGQHAPRVADGQRADPVPHGPGDDGAGGFVLGLADPAAVPHLHQALAALAMVGSGTRNARAISAVVSPASVRSVRATRASSGSAG
jgi:hypothetical protein